MSGSMYNFKEQQRKLVSLIRHPNKLKQEKLSVDDKERIEIYQRLIFNNIDGFLRNAFPVSYRMLNKSIWNEVVSIFIADYRCESPIFSDIAEQFLDFISSTHDNMPSQIPSYLGSLMHYEWIELVLDRRESRLSLPCWDGTTMPDNVIASDVAELLHYQYPVHAIGGDLSAEAEMPREDCFYVVFRDQQYRVRFNRLNPASAAIFSLLFEDFANKPTSIVTIQQKAQSIFPHIDECSINQQVTALLIDGLRQGFLFPQ